MGAKQGGRVKGRQGDGGEARAGRRDKEADRGSGR